MRYAVSVLITSLEGQNQHLSHKISDFEAVFAVMIGLLQRIQDLEGPNYQRQDSPCTAQETQIKKDNKNRLMCSEYNSIVLDQRSQPRNLAMLCDEMHL